MTPNGRNPTLFFKIPFITFRKTKLIAETVSNERNAELSINFHCAQAIQSVYLQTVLGQYAIS